MSLRDDLIKHIQSNLADTRLDDPAHMAHAIGMAEGLSIALYVAQRYGVADGEDWKARAEDAEEKVAASVAIAQSAASLNYELQRKIDTLEAKVSELFPDAPEEGIDDVD